MHAPEVSDWRPCLGTSLHFILRDAERRSCRWYGTLHALLISQFDTFACQAYSYLNYVCKDYAFLQEATSKSFLHSSLLYLASSAGAAVKFTMLHNHSDSSHHVGAIICDFTQKNNPSALIMMRAEKSSVTRFFEGSVTTYCAVHSGSPVIIVPE